jgi:hypothetical protein
MDKESLVDYDRRTDFAAWVVERAGLLWRLDEEQAWRVGTSKIDVVLWQDNEEQYKLLVRRGWPRPKPPQALLLAEVVQ